MIVGSTKNDRICEQMWKVLRINRHKISRDRVRLNVPLDILWADCFSINQLRWWQAWQDSFQVDWWTGRISVLLWLIISGGRSSITSQFCRFTANRFCTFFHFAGIIADNFADEVILEPTEIAKHYLKTFFFLDLISSLPLDYILLSVSPETSVNQLVHAGLFCCLFFCRISMMLVCDRLLMIWPNTRPGSAQPNVKGAV